MTKVEVHGRRRLLDGFFQDERRIDDAKTLIALMWLRARQGE